MERRDVLKSASALAAASTVGLAGCSGGGPLGGGGCDTPGDNLEDSLPDSDDYEQQGEVFTTEGEDQEDIERSAFAAYSGPDGEEFVFAVTEYSSSDVASEEADNGTDEGTGDFGTVGYIQTDAFIFVGGGPDESSVEEFMGTSPTLEGCVGDNIEFI
jgi:hypothetical protein